MEEEIPKGDNSPNTVEKASNIDPTDQPGEELGPLHMCEFEHHSGEGGQAFLTLRIVNRADLEEIGDGQLTIRRSMHPDTVLGRRFSVVGSQSVRRSAQGAAGSDDAAVDGEDRPGQVVRAVGEKGHRRRDVLQHAADGETLEVELHLAGLDLLQVEQIIDQQRDAFAVLGCNIDSFLHL